MINERQIRYLLAIADTGSITGAAERLYVTQPALSRMLIDLERKLGCELFIRDRHRMTPTRAGEIYLRGCREVLACARSVRSEIADLLDGERGSIVFGMTSFTAEFLLPRIWGAFTERYPDVRIVLAEERMRDLGGMVRSGAVDLALVYHADDDELESEPVLTDPVYIQVPSARLEGLGLTPGASGAPLEPHALEGQPLVLLKQGRHMRSLADGALRALGIRPGEVAETENIHIASELAELSGGFTFVPGMAARQLLAQGTSVAFCELVGYPMQRELRCCTRRGRYLTRAERYLVDLIRTL